MLVNGKNFDSTTYTQEVSERLKTIGENETLLFNEIASNGIKETDEKTIEVSVNDLSQLSGDYNDVYEGNADLSNKQTVLPDTFENPFQEFVIPYGYTFKSATGRQVVNPDKQKDQAILRAVKSIEHFTFNGRKDQSKPKSDKFQGILAHSQSGGNIITLGETNVDGDGKVTVINGKLTDVSIYEALQKIDEDGGLGNDMVMLCSNNVAKVLTFVLKHGRDVLDPATHQAKFKLFETDLCDIRRIRGGKLLAGYNGIIILPKEEIFYQMQKTKLEVEGVVLGEGYFLDVLKGIDNTEINKFIYTKMSLDLPLASRMAVINNIDTNLNNYSNI